MNSAFRPLLVVFMVLIGMVGFSTWRKLREPEERIPWRQTLEAARAESAASKKPVLAYFTATWCGPCQRMKSETWPDARVEAALNDFIPVKIDVDQFPGAAREFNVDGIPRLQLIYPDGRVGPAHVGLILPDGLLRWLRGA
jgi:thiol:disulfide interchange protein